MDKVREIVMSTDNIFVALYRLLQYGWEALGWWLVVGLVIQFLVVGYLYYRYIAGVHTWQFYDK